MYEELIEKIKLIDSKFDEKHRTNPFTLDAYIEGWKHCKSEMLEIIESCKPKVLDEPESECGWYYFKKDKESHNSLPSGYYWLNSWGDYRVQTGFNTFIDVSNFEGKWIKMSEME